ncbi:hypothetical protein BRC91_06715 [Halobacteriales archaeon QS_4_62_28]|nr:MAG: hypothetical protein BRC91_06715 [Halobacteriales archaeon QS_4_62_28]
MRRRAVLRAVGSGVAVTSAGITSAHPTPTESETRGTDATSTPATRDSDPLATLEIEQTRETVVSDDGTTAYVATVDGFVVADIADPTAPTLVTEERVLADHEDGPLTGIWDLHVDGDRLLVVGPANRGPSLRGFGYFDVTDPAAPEAIAAHETDFYIHNCVLDDGVAYLTGSGARGSPLVIIDPESGDELARWALRDHDERWEDVPRTLISLHDVWVQGDYASLAYWDGGTWILDISDPAVPTLVSRVRGRSIEELDAIEDPDRERLETPGNDHFVTVDESGDLLGVGSESWAADTDAENGPGGIEFYDVSDPTEPTQLSRIEPPPTPDATYGGAWTTAHNFELVGGRCYAAWYRGGVTVHDVSDPTNPVELFRWRDDDRAKFWTAQRCSSGSAFVASSIGAYPKNEEDTDSEPPLSGLFTFPTPEVSTPTETTGGQTANDDSSAMDSGQTTDGTGDGGLSVGLLGLLGLGGLYRRYRRLE